jgi:hypothetical protein
VKESQEGEAMTGQPIEDVRWRLMLGHAAPAALVLVATLAAPADAAGAVRASSGSLLVGTWRAVLISPGGELPFTLRVDEGAGGLSAVAMNGEERARFDSVRLEEGRVALRFDVYDSELRAELAPDGSRLTGEWWKAGRTRLPLTAVRGDPRRFLPGVEAGKTEGSGLAGAWAVVFKKKSGDEPARGEFRQEGDRVLGTFLTPTGDHRYLEGDLPDAGLGQTGKAT